LLLVLFMTHSGASPQFPEQDVEPSTTQAPTPPPTAPAIGNGATVIAPTGTAVTGTNCAARVQHLSGANQAAPGSAQGVIDLWKYSGQILIEDEAGGGFYGVSICDSIDYYKCPNTTCSNRAELQKVSSFGSFADAGAGIVDGSTTSMNLSYVGGAANSCGKQSGALVQVACGFSIASCMCNALLCVCPPSVESCDDASFPGRPFFHVYVPEACQASESARAGFNIGTTAMGSELIKNGINAGSATHEYLANDTTATIYLSLTATSSGASEVLTSVSNLKFHQPILNDTDFLGKVTVSDSGAADLGGVLSAGAANSSFTLEFDCTGSMSVATIGVQVPIPPYDPVSFQLKKICPEAIAGPSAPSDVKASMALLGGTQVTLTWRAPAGTVTAYKVQPVLKDGSVLEPAMYQLVQLSSQSPPTVLIPGLPTGQSYTFQVAAADGPKLSTYSAPSNSIDLVSGDAGAPPPPPPPPADGGTKGIESKHTNSDMEPPQEIDESDGSNSYYLFWFICLWVALCVCCCVYRHNQGEQGLDILPGAAIIYRIDDAVFDGKYTSSQSFNKVSTTDEGTYPGASSFTASSTFSASSPRIPSEQVFEIPNMAQVGDKNYQDL